MYLCLHCLIFYKDKMSGGEKEWIINNFWSTLWVIKSQTDEDVPCLSSTTSSSTTWALTGVAEASKSVSVLSRAWSNFSNQSCRCELSTYDLGKLIWRTIRWNFFGHHGGWCGNNCLFLIRDLKDSLNWQLDKMTRVMIWSDHGAPDRDLYQPYCQTNSVIFFR